MASGPLHHLEERGEPRDEVLHRARLTLADRRRLDVLVVNVSPRGLMIRSDVAVAVGEWVTVALPTLGDVHAAVCWTLGGRIGCQLERAVPLAGYHAMLGAMRR